MIFCQLMLPALPWKSMPVPCDILDDQFGIFSLSAILEVYGEGEGRSSISMQRQQRCVGLGTASDVEDIRATLETLLDLLPQESRHVIGRMMEPLPAERAGWAEILSDPWVRQIECATARNAT
jgi:hypothetical protein